MDGAEDGGSDNAASACSTWITYSQQRVQRFSVNVKRCGEADRPLRVGCGQRGVLVIRERVSEGRRMVKVVTLVVPSGSFRAQDIPKLFSVSSFRDLYVFGPGGV